MFRKMRRENQQLPASECIKILKEEKRGVLGVSGDGGYPYVMPMNFYFDEEKNKIYFHGAKAGHKVDAIKRNDKVSFCVYDKGTPREGHWSLDVKSVIVFGRLSETADFNEGVKQVRALSLKYSPDPEEIERDIREAAAHTMFWELNIEHMTGKKVNEA